MEEDLGSSKLFGAKDFNSSDEIDWGKTNENTIAQYTRAALEYSELCNLNRYLNTKLRLLVLLQFIVDGLSLVVFASTHYYFYQDAVLFMVTNLILSLIHFRANSVDRDRIKNVFHIREIRFFLLANYNEAPNKAEILNTVSQLEGQIVTGFILGKKDRAYLTITIIFVNVIVQYFFLAPISLQVLKSIV